MQDRASVPRKAPPPSQVTNSTPVSLPPPNAFPPGIEAGRPLPLTPTLLSRTTPVPSDSEQFPGDEEYCDMLRYLYSYLKHLQILTITLHIAVS